MKLPTQIALTLLAGLALAALTGQELRAQAQAPAYYITQIELTGDAGEFAKNYGSQVGATLAPYGGRFLVRGTPAMHLEGDAARSRNAVIQFDSLAQAQAWYTSPAYQKLIPIRQKLTKTNSYLVEGVAP
jgi:uncharacterized protein (DUF1330 family)